MKTYCLMNHQLTENQKNELACKFGSLETVYPSKELSVLWAQVPTEEKLDRGIVSCVTDWLSDAENGDLLVVQGEMGLTFIIVDYALQKGLIPLHAVTRREETETCTGEKVDKHYVFRHVCFRRYERW